MTAVGFAKEILDMQLRIDRLEQEVTFLMGVEEDLHALLHSSTAHNEKMMFNLLKVAMTPGVSEALGAAASRPE